MEALFNSRMWLIHRQVLLSWKHFAVPRCVSAVVGRSWESVRQNTSLKQTCSSIRHLTSSSLLHDLKQLADETKCMDNDTSPAEILASLSPEDDKRLKVLKLEYDVFMSTGVRVPDSVSDEDWVHMLHNCRSPASRVSYYNFLFKREKAIEANRRTRTANRLAAEERKRIREQQKLEGTYEFLNTFLLHIRETTMNQWYNNNLCYALMNGPHLVFDFSFENQMNDRELTNLMRQLQLCHGDNKSDREPFHFHFCNLARNSRTAKKLEFAIKNVYDLPYTVTDQHYLQCYDRSRIVYLSPNAPTFMTSFNPDDVYVIGCIVDKRNEKPLTFARAKEEKIRCVRFPFEQHVRWVQGSKSLTLNHVVNILLTLNRTNDWVQALTRNIPKRKFNSE